MVSTQATDLHVIVSTSDTEEDTAGGEAPTASTSQFVQATTPPPVHIPDDVDAGQPFPRLLQFWTSPHGGAS